MLRCVCGSLWSENSKHFPAQPPLIGFYNRDGDCLLRGTSNSVFKVVLWLSHSVDGLSTRTPRFDPNQVHVSVVVVSTALEQVVLRVIGFFCCLCGPSRVQFSSSRACCSYQKDKWAKPGDLPNNALQQIGENWTKKYFHFFSMFRMLALMEKAKPNMRNIRTKLERSSTWYPWKDQAGIIARARSVKAWFPVLGLDWQRPCLHCTFE